MNTLLVLSGIIMGGLSGWMVGKVCFEKEELGCSAVALCAGISIAQAATVVSIAWFVSWAGLLGAFTVIPAFWIARSIDGFLNGAPELWEERPSFKSAEESKKENENFAKVLGLVLGLLSGGIVAACNTLQTGIDSSSYELIRAIFSATFGAMLSAVPAYGAFWVIAGTCGLGMVGVSRLLKCVDKLGHWLSSALPCGNRK